MVLGCAQHTPDATFQLSPCFVAASVLATRFTALPKTWSKKVIPAPSAWTASGLVLQGEVWEVLKTKLQTGTEDGFCCLVAEDAAQPAGIVGIVEVSLQGEKVGLLGVLSPYLSYEGNVLSSSYHVD